MVQLAATIIFIISALVASFILYRKIPALVQMPKKGDTGLREHYLILGIENKIKDIYTAFQKQIFLHKLLSRAKCWIIKIEVKIDYLLHGIRKKAQEVDKKNNGKNGKNLLL